MASARRKSARRARGSGASSATDGLLKSPPPAAATADYSRAIAQDLGLTVERARTLLAMGNGLRDVSLVDEATRVFEQTGTKVDLAFSLHTRAMLETDCGADVESLLQRYDQATAALDEVKAEYALGIACRQRAQLHKQCGRLDQARADLAQAQRCFAAVEAVVEQTNVEQEASTLGEKDGSA